MPTVSLASEAAHALQLRDELLQIAEDENYLDTGDALNVIERLTGVCQRILKEETEL